MSLNSSLNQNAQQTGRYHPAQRLFDALVVVPVDVLVDQGKHLVAGAFLPMLGIDGLRLHATEVYLFNGLCAGLSRVCWPCYR